MLYKKSKAGSNAGLQEKKLYI